MNIVISFNPYRETDAAQALATQLRSADPDAVVVLSAQPDRYWGSDARFPVSDWQEEAANDYTRQGYWEWVQSQRESGAEGRVDEDTDDGQNEAPEPVQRPSRAILARDVTAGELALDSPGPEGWSAQDVIGTKGSQVTVLDRDKAEAIGDSVEARDFDRDFTASGFIPLDALEGR